MSGAHLFDVEPYGGPDKPVKPKAEPPEPVVIELGRNAWGLVVLSKFPEAHALLPREDADRFKRGSQVPIVSSAAITYCRRAGTPLTFEPGTKAAACPICIDRGART